MAAMIILMCMLSLVTGCVLARALAIQTAPTTEKVAPEFNRLIGKRVLVYVWAPPEIRFDYSKICLELSAYVSAYLKQNVEDVELVDAWHVQNYREKKGSPETDPVQLGRHFRADMVIHLSVYHFSMRDPGWANFYRGRLSSSVMVYDLTVSDESAESVPLKDVVVVVPDKDPIGFHNTDPAQVRQATYKAFAVETGIKFHEYERAIN